MPGATQCWTLLVFHSLVPLVSGMRLSCIALAIHSRVKIPGRGVDLLRAEVVSSGRAGKLTLPTYVINGSFRLLAHASIYLFFRKS